MRDKGILRARCDNSPNTTALQGPPRGVRECIFGGWFVLGFIRLFAGGLWRDMDRASKVKCAPPFHWSGIHGMMEDGLSGEEYCFTIA